MTWLSAQARGRLVAGVFLAGVGYLVAIWLDFEPRPLPYAVWAVVVLTMTYLVIDTAEAHAAQWHHGLRAPSDRVDEATADLRVLTDHQNANEPSDALVHRLVELARGRDPALAADIQQELAGARRVPPADIDRILTRIEDVRERR